MYKYILCSSWTFTVLQGLDAALPQNIWIKWMTQYQAFAKLDVIMSDGLNKSKSKHHVTDQKVISMIFLIRCSILNSIFVFAGNKHLFFLSLKKTQTLIISSCLSLCLLMIKMSQLFIFYFLSPQVLLEKIGKHQTSLKYCWIHNSYQPRLPCGDHRKKQAAHSCSPSNLYLHSGFKTCVCVRWRECVCVGWLCTYLRLVHTNSNQ